MTTYNATWIRRVAWSLDGTRLAGGGEDGYIYLWDARGGTQMLQLAGHHGAVTSVAWSADSTQLSRGSESQGQGGGEESFLWDAQSGERVCTLEGHPGMAGCAGGRCRMESVCGYKTTSGLVKRVCT